MIVYKRLIFITVYCMLVRKSIVALLLFILASCATPTRENFDQELTSYHGMNVDELVKVWGPPHGFYETQDKSRIYQWVQNGGSMHFQGASYPWIGAQSHAYGPWNHALWPAWGGGLYNTGVSMIVSRPMMLDRSCTLNITANQQNVVVRHSAIGAGCVAE